MRFNENCSLTHARKEIEEEMKGSESFNDMIYLLLFLGVEFVTKFVLNISSSFGCGQECPPVAGSLGGLPVSVVRREERNAW